MAQIKPEYPYSFRKKFFLSWFRPTGRIAEFSALLLFSSKLVPLDWSSRFQSYTVEFDQFHSRTRKPFDRKISPLSVVWFWLLNPRGIFLPCSLLRIWNFLVFIVFAIMNTAIMEPEKSHTHQTEKHLKWKEANSTVSKFLHKLFRSHLYSLFFDTFADRYLSIGFKTLMVCPWY